MRLKNVNLPLVILGLILLGSPLAIYGIRNAIVVYPSTFWVHFFPDGTRDQPTLISPGSTITLTVKCVSFDATEDVDLGNPFDWKASVTIKRLDGSTVASLGMGNKEFGVGENVNGHTCNTVAWSQEWTVPNTEGVVYEFIWAVEIYGDDGQYLTTAKTSTFAKTPLDEPDGYFEINGERADQTSTIIVMDPTLTLKFTPTKNPEKITAVKVEVWKAGSLRDTVTLSKQSDGTYSGSYTLPAAGTYELKGYIEWSDGSPLRRMSIVAQYGEDEDGSPNVMKIIAIISGITGTIFLALGLMGKKLA